MKAMKKVTILSVVVALLSSPSIASAVCREHIYPSEISGRNYWAQNWGYLPPGLAADLTSNHLYVEFNVGCYRSADGSPCAPIIPVTTGAGYVGGLTWVDFCPQYDCYTPSQRVLVEGKYIGIEDASRLHSAVVATLGGTPEKDVTLLEQPVASFSTSQVRDDLFILQGENGERLEVTRAHPIVKADGSVVKAETLKAGDLTLGVDGGSVRLTSVTTQPYEGPVWNLTTDNKDKFANIIAVEGFFAGTLYFQEQWGDDTFRLFVRDTMSLDKSAEAE